VPVSQQLPRLISSVSGTLGGFFQHTVPLNHI